MHFARLVKQACVDLVSDLLGCEPFVCSWGLHILSPCYKEQLFAQIWVCKLDKGFQNFQPQKMLTLVRFDPKIYMSVFYQSAIW